MSEYKNYCKTRRVVGYVVPETKAMVSQEAYDNNIAISDIVCKAMDEYYERRPELVSSLKERIGKNRFWLLVRLWFKLSYNPILLVLGYFFYPTVTNLKLNRIFVYTLLQHENRNNKV